MKGKQAMKTDGVGSMVTGNYRTNELVAAFARRMLKWRRDEGKTLKQVAEDMGVCIAIVSEWEHGNRFPSVDNLHAISLYTGIPAWQLLKP